jgi:branched-chain amino acid transport system substrate-binding protein
MRRLGGLSLATVLLLLTGCGSQLNNDELAAAQGVFTEPVEDPSLASRSAPAQPGAAGTAGPDEVAPAVEPGATVAAIPAAGSTRPVTPNGSGARLVPGAATPTAAPGSGPSATPGRPAPSTAASSDPKGPSAAPAPGPAEASAPVPTPGGVTTPTRPEIRLGSVGTATGVIGAATQPIVAATKAWAADVNTRGGLKGHPVRVIFGDDGGDPSRAQSLVRKMVEEEKVIAFVGTYLVITTAAVTGYVEKMQVPVIGGPGGNEVEDSSPMFFNPQMGADEALGHGLVHNIVAQTKARKIATFYCREASSCAAQAKRVKEYAHLYGAEVVLEAQVSLAQPDFTGEILAARSAGADAIVSAVDEASTVRVARSAKQQNYDPVIAGSYTVNNDVLLRAGEDAVGIIGFSATAPYGSSPLLQPYRDAVARHVPGARLAGYGATAWVQGKLVERLADFFGDLPNPTSADVLRALYSLKDETLGGLVPPITFNEGGHGRVNRCMVPIRIGDGRIEAPLGDDHFVCAKA